MTRVLDPAAPELDQCLRGSIPMAVATCSVSGVTNVTYVSRVHRVDGERLALSNQFLGKTRRNLAEHPFASLLAIHPRTYVQYRIDVQYERTERSGPVFDALRRDVDALAALGGPTARFRLESAEVLRIVGAVQVHPDPDWDDVVGTEDAESEGAEERLYFAADLADVAGRVTALEELVTAAGHLVAAMRPDVRIVHAPAYAGRLNGDGAGTAGPDGGAVRDLLAVVARTAEPIRLDDVILSHRYARRILGPDDVPPEDEGLRGGRVEDDAAATGPPPRSVAAAPVLRRGELVGVVGLVSPEVAAFGRDDVATVRLLARLLEPFLPGSHPSGSEASDVDGQQSRSLVDVAEDGTVFVDHEYVIRGLGGDLLAYLLRINAETGRTDFTNRELRSAPELAIPGLRENLESRLLELQRRLEDRALPLRITRTGRGRFTLEIGRPFTLAQPPRPR